jgi:hypothetical protein
MSAATITCPWCASRLAARPTLQAGSRLQCPLCGAEFTLLAENIHAAAPARPPRMLAWAAMLLLLIAAAVGVALLLPVQPARQVAVAPTPAPVPAADLSFTVQDVNDLIKSMVVRDLDGKQASATSDDGLTPVEKTLQSYAENLSSDPTFGQILNHAAGEKVEVPLQVNR